jgi:hypothetical protein
MKKQGAALSHRRCHRGCFRRDCLPNRAAWRFPDWTAVGLAFPSPFLGSAPLGIPLPEHSRLVGLDLTGVGSLSLRDPQTTGGDSNPDCPLAFSRLSFGWPGRWPPTFAVPAFICFARSFAIGKSDYFVRSVLLFRRVTFAPDDAGKYIHPQAKSLVFFAISKPLIHPRAQLLVRKAKPRCINRWII